MMNTDNLVGNTLSGRYEVIEKVGSGGMASVFKARDTLLNRLVAIKVFKTSADDEKVSQSFIKEAQSAASLTHNNIVSVYDVGEEDGIKYIVMELVDGITLKEYIKKTGTLPWQEACDFALQIGQGIGFAHDSSIIHRDIKPQNIIMTKDKTLKVTDFGIARVAAGDTIVGGTALGSVHYISPEQARGGHTDERSDIYSLGVVLYEMLAGRVPFDGETPVTVALMHLEKEPVNVRCINMDIPKSLAYVTMKAISKEPSGRYKNIEEFLEDIHAVLAEEPLPSVEDMAEEIETPVVYEDEFEDYFDEEENYIEEDLSYKNSKKNKKRAKKAAKKVRQPKSAKQKREDRNAVMLAFLTLIIMAVVGFCAYSIFGVTKGVKAPDLINMTLEEAQAAVEALDKNIKIDEEIEYTISDEIEEGRVVSHTPEKGEFVAKGDKIKLVLSIGSSGGDISVPDVVGEEFDRAISKILDKGLTYVVVEEESRTARSGEVIRQLPIAGTMLNRDDIVTLYVCKSGSEPTQSPGVVKKTTVPKLVGMGKDDAIIAIEAAGLVVTSVNKQFSDSLDGLVIAQSPEYPMTVEEGTGVSIIVSKGPKTEEVPEQDPGEVPVEPQTPSTETGTEATQTPSGNMTEKTKQFTVKIPESSGATVRIEIRANDTVIHSAEHNKTEGYVTVDIPGTSGNVSVQAWIDGALAAQRTLNFD